jgi:hypothetical protein
VINAVADAQGQAPGLARLEASVLAAFPAAQVFVGPLDEGNDSGLVNVIVVAGRELEPAAEPPADVRMASTLAILLPRGRPARATVAATTDDWSDLDYVDAPLRRRWRELLLELGSIIDPQR